LEGSDELNEITRQFRIIFGNNLISKLEEKEKTTPESKIPNYQFGSLNEYITEKKKRENSSLKLLGRQQTAKAPQNGLSRRLIEHTSKPSSANSSWQLIIQTRKI
jgi:hypothetical protein